MGMSFNMTRKNIQRSLAALKKDYPNTSQPALLLLATRALVLPFYGLEPKNMTRKRLTILKECLLGPITSTVILEAHKAVTTTMSNSWGVQDTELIELREAAHILNM